MVNQAAIEAQVDHAMAILDALSDKWVAETDLVVTIKNVVSPMNLHQSAPSEVRERFKAEMEQKIYAIARQAFIEGVYRAIAGLQDEEAEMRRQGIEPLRRAVRCEQRKNRVSESRQNRGGKS
jgi:hypothetical protein